MLETYRGWAIRASDLVMFRGMEYTATSPDYGASYEGPEDGGWTIDGTYLLAETVDELKKKIDEWIEEHSDAE